MSKLRATFVSLLIAALVVVGLAGCGGKDNHEHPTNGDHPAAEHPEGEHPTKEKAEEKAAEETPTKDHPAGEHPAGEHPK